MKKQECPNCQGENAKTGYVEDWDGICPDCGRKIKNRMLGKENSNE
ncbi:MAG: hypothetical protein WC908_03455 [Candidatus Paceibacterota bacterium]